LPYAYLLVPSLHLDSIKVCYYILYLIANKREIERDTEVEKELLKLIITEKKWKAEIIKR
jgi:hypothetical protein